MLDIFRLFNILLRQHVHKENTLRENAGKIQTSGILRVSFLRALSVKKLELINA